MSISRDEAHKLVDEIFDNVAGEEAQGPIEPIEAEEVEVETEEATEPRVLPEGKRVVRTKSSGDRVYCLDEEKGTRRWVTNPQILDGLGFEANDVTEVEDSELLKYQMGPAIYRIDNES
jgi:hypothetical protein